MYGRFDKNGFLIEKLPFKLKGLNLIKIPKTLESEKFLKLVNGKVMINEELKEKEIRLQKNRKLQEYIERYIFQNYPQSKQNSDLADKLYYENLLKANGIKNLESDIVKRVEEYYKGKNLDEVISDVADENKESYLQLIKVGIRVTWVQMCKNELKKAIEEQREPEFPKYPL